MILAKIKNVIDEEVNNKLRVIKHNVYNDTKQKLKNIFYNELKSENSIFIYVNDNIYSQITLFLLKEINRPVSIGIAGETASGKSTITLDIINTVLKFAQCYSIQNSICRINTDDYYYDRSELVREYGSFEKFAQNYDLDSPDAIELDLMGKHILDLLSGKKIYLPKYDMSGTAKRTENCVFAEPSKIILSEGLFTLNHKVSNVFDIKIYVDVSYDVQKKRFFKRAYDRDLGASAQCVYENASKKAKIHIHPTKDIADIIISGECDRSRYCNFISNILNLIEELHFIK